MVLRTMVYVALRISRCETEAPAEREEQYSIELQMKALKVDESSDVPRKDFSRQRMPTWRLELEDNHEAWFAKERS